MSYSPKLIKVFCQSSPSYLFLNLQVCIGRGCITTGCRGAPVTLAPPLRILGFGNGIRDIGFKISTFLLWLLGECLWYGWHPVCLGHPSSPLPCLLSTYPVCNLVANEICLHTFRWSTDSHWWGFGKNFSSNIFLLAEILFTLILLLLGRQTFVYENQSALSCSGPCSFHFANWSKMTKQNFFNVKLFKLFSLIVRGLSMDWWNHLLLQW